MGRKPSHVLFAQCSTLLLIAAAALPAFLLASDEGWESLEPQVHTIHPRIVVRDSAGKEISSTRQFRGKAQWFFEDTDAVPTEALNLHSRAQSAGSAGNYDEALRLLWQAHRISPGWLYPVYDAAWTYFLRGDPARAEQLYAWVDRMEPGGYFTTKEALDCLAKERSGRLPTGAYRDYCSLEWIDDPIEHRQKLEELVKHAQLLAPAWKDLAVLRPDPPGRMKAVEAGLRASPDAETRGFLLLHKADLLVEFGREVEADSIRAFLASDSVSTSQTRAIARFERAANPLGRGR